MEDENLLAETLVVIKMTSDDKRFVKPCRVTFQLVRPIIVLDECAQVDFSRWDEASANGKGNDDANQHHN